MNQEQKDKLAAALGIPKEEQVVLDVGSNHPYTCKCSVCLEWWLQMGPEDDGTPEGSYGPSTKAEIDVPTNPARRHKCKSVKSP